MNDLELIQTAVSSLWKTYECATHSHNRQQVLMGLRILTETLGEAEFCTPEQFTEWYASELKFAHDLVGVL